MNFFIDVINMGEIHVTHGSEKYMEGKCRKVRGFPKKDRGQEGLNGVGQEAGRIPRVGVR